MPPLQAFLCPGPPNPFRDHRFPVSIDLSLNLTSAGRAASLGAPAGPRPPRRPRAGGRIPLDRPRGSATVIAGPGGTAAGPALPDSTMKHSAVLLAALLLLTAALAGCLAGTAPTTPPRTSGDKWAEFPAAGYVVANDVWGQGPGPQTLWMRSAGDWGVRANHPDTTGIKAYPHVGRVVDRRLDALTACASRFAVAVPAAGSYNSAYDIWCDHHACEIMLWMNWRGKMGPIARSWNAQGQPAVELADVAVGGHTWDVYKGTNGQNVVITLLCKTPVTAGAVDVKAVLDWIRSRGWFAAPRDVLVDEVQFGWEIAASPGGLDFAVTDFSVDVR